MTEKRNIRTIAPLLAGDFIDLEDSIFDTDKYSAFLNNNSRRLGIFRKYLICKLHDSWIIDIKQEFDRFEIVLNDFSTYVFADTLIKKYKLSIDPDHMSFPLTIGFEGNLKVEYNEIDDQGNLIQVGPAELDVFLYEQVRIVDENKIEIVFHFWKSRVKENKPGERIIVIASATNLKLKENQDQAWREIFGHQYDGLYKYFKEQFDSDRYVSDHNKCEKLIEEYHRKRRNDQKTPSA